jgi:hypothetical protein
MLMLSGLLTAVKSLKQGIAAKTCGKEAWKSARSAKDKPQSLFVRLFLLAIVQMMLCMQYCFLFKYLMMQLNRLTRCGALAVPRKLICR